MKIIDWKSKGNLIRFYLGQDNCINYTGDDWNDFPYEHNAGPVYDEYKEGHIDLLFPFEYVVMNPKDDWRYDSNSPWCKNDFKTGRCPIIVAVHEKTGSWWDNCFTDASASKNSIKIYMNDDESKILELMEKFKHEEGLCLKLN